MGIDEKVGRDLVIPRPLSVLLGKQSLEFVVAAYKRRGDRVADHAAPNQPALLDSIREDHLVQVVVEPQVATDPESLPYLSLTLSFGPGHAS